MCLPLIKSLEPHVQPKEEKHLEGGGICSMQPASQMNLLDFLCWPKVPLHWPQGLPCAAPFLTPVPGEDTRPFSSFPAKNLELCCSVHCHPLHFMPLK